MSNMCSAVWKIILIQLILVIRCKDHRCELPTLPELQGVTIPGDIMIGVLLPINIDKIYQKVTFNVRPPRTSCTVFSLDYFQTLQTLIFAIEEINQNPNILPNIKLGFQMYDTCNVAQYELQGALRFLIQPSVSDSFSLCNSSSHFPAVVGSVVSANSIIIAQVLGISRYPQISPYSSVSILSDQNLFPSFFRTLPSDKIQVKAIVKLIVHFGWTWVGLVGPDNDYGILAIQPIKEELIKTGICVAFTEYIRLDRPDRNAPNIVKTIKESSAKVIVVFSTDAIFAPVVNELVKQSVTGRTIIGNAGWSRSILLSTSSYFPALNGTIGFAGYNYQIPGLREFLTKIHPVLSAQQDWVNTYREKIFNCRFANVTGLGLQVKQCTGNESFEGINANAIFMSSIKNTPYAYAAIPVLAKALEDLQNCTEGKGPFAGGSCANIWSFKPWQLTYYVRKFRLILSSGKNLYFDDKGEPPSNYSLVNWQMTADGTVRQIQFGSYSTSVNEKILDINADSVLWSTGSNQVPRSVCSKSCSSGFRKASIQGQPSCCFECLPCLQGEISNKSDSANCFSCPWDQWPNNEKSSCFPKPMEYLPYEDILGSTLATASIMSALIPASILWIFVYHKNTPIIKASNYSLSSLLLISLCLGFLSSLGFIGYPNHERCLLRQVSFCLVFTLCVSCILAKTIMVVFAFMATRPGSSLKKWTRLRVSYTIIFTCFLIEFILCLFWLFLTPPFPQYNIETKPGIIIIDCNEGSPTAFWITLGYLFFLATISFIVAFLARRLPDSFNEAQFITFSMLAFLSVWISYIPASLSAQGKYTVAMEIFAILASSWALVICMFLPKCFIILFRPDMNTKEYLMKREKK